MDITGTYGTLRNETRPTFNGSKISPSNASIRIDDGGEESGLRALYVIQRVYTSGCTGCLHPPVGLIKHKRAAGAARDAKGCGWPHESLLKQVPSSPRRSRHRRDYFVSAAIEKYEKRGRSVKKVAVARGFSLPDIKRIRLDQACQTRGRDFLKISKKKY